jgi:leucyl-tRNA synthetase
MAQQDFLGRFRRWFSGPSDTYFFGLQIAIKSFGEDTVRARFAHVLEDEREADEDVQEKRRLLRRFVALLEENALFWTYGYWDYIDDREAAIAEFNSWANDIEGSMATEEEELGTQVDEVRRTSSRKDYVVVTLVFLLDQSYAPAEAITHEDANFLKETFSALVQGLTSIDPHAIQADGIYIRPGNAADGLSEDDLLGPGWEYLRLLL